MSILSYNYDADTLLKDAGLIAASAASQVGGVNRILDLGNGAQMHGVVIIDITALEVASGNEKYDLIWQLSSSATFASDILSGPRIVLGDSSVNDSSADSAVGRYLLPVTNNINGTIYQYARLYILIAGTIATGINGTAYLSVIPG